MPKDGDDLNVDEPPKQAEGPVPPETALLGGRHGSPLIEDPFHRALGKSVEELVCFSHNDQRHLGGRQPPLGLVEAAP